MPATRTSNAPTPDSGAALEPAEAAQQRVLRSGCGLLDRSQRGKLALSGAGAVDFLNGQVTNDVEMLQIGGGCYAAFLTHKGKMLGDIRILRTEDELLLDTERVALQALFDMIRRFKVGYDVELHKRTLESSLLSLIGRKAREVAAGALPTNTPSAKALPADIEHAHAAASIAGRQVRLIATARPEGLDVLCASEDLADVSAALIAAGATPVSEEAAEALRVEHGVPRYGLDIEPESVIPQEAGLNERAVSFTKGCYVGQETVARLHYRGKPNRLLRGLLLQRPLATGEEVHLGERLIGRLGTSVFSAELGPIALALLRREANPGAIVAIGAEQVAGEVVELPFAGHR